jgi:predicted metalloprotease with PDZ domain
VKVQVTFDVTRPETHLVRVTQKFPATDDSVRTFLMPGWVPGAYEIVDYARNVQDLVCIVGGKEVKVPHPTKDSWVVKGTAGKVVEFEYDVYGRHLDVHSNHVTSEHAHLFPGSLTLYDENTRGLPYQVTIKKPAGWTVWSGLEGKSLDGKLTASDDFDHLLDCPIEIGPAADYYVETFTVRGKKHRILLWKPPAEMDGARIKKDVAAIVKATGELFGGLPYDHFIFIGHVALDHGGGLEHRNSTVLGLDPLDLTAEDKIQTHFGPLVAHEFFHTWNVKRIQPKAFQAYDLQHEVYTDLLWLFEGFTSYYELPLLKRAGVIDDKHFGKLVADMLKYYEMAIGRKRISASDASRMTWTLLYKPHEHNINRNVSYYTKGMWIGLCLDHHLRTNGVTEGLDTVMQYLWKHHAIEGVPENGFPAIVKAATGVDCSAKLRAWTHGTKELPYVRAFKELGWDVKHEHEDPEHNIGLGIHFKEDGATIARIPEDGPAGKSLNPDDELVAVDGLKWSGKRFSGIASNRKEGDTVQVTVFRDGRLKTLDATLRTLPKDKITVELRKKDAASTRRRHAWLGGDSKPEKKDSKKGKKAKS